MDFLPVNMDEVRALGWDAADFVLVSGDAYVDHPSFGAALLGRVLESQGYRVAMLPQPDFSNEKAFKTFGRPRLGFLISGGVVDSMVAHYTVSKRRRTFDEYTPGGAIGKRPDRAVEVYARLAKRAYLDVPVIIGGVEASLRRFAHYDYWDDAVRPGILQSSGADLISFGMGERSLTELARRLAAGEGIETIRDIPGTAYLTDFAGLPAGYIECASFDKVKKDKTAYAKAAALQLDNQDPLTAKPIVQKHGAAYVVQNPPAQPLSREELDALYTLSFTRRWHPAYDGASRCEASVASRSETREPAAGECEAQPKHEPLRAAGKGGVPALEEVEFSITHNRGCFGGCAFCAITMHQGRRVTSRSAGSVVAEAERLTRLPGFKGYIHDVGGPTANFRGPSCEHQNEHGMCKGGRRCLAPSPCPRLMVDHSEYLEMLRRVRAVPGVKKVFIRSGIRYDYLMHDQDERFFKELVAHHVSGQLKVAPEHCAPAVLRAMGKPSIETYDRFSKRFYQLTKQAGKEQYLVPYLISSHPGSTLRDAVELALWLKKNNLRPEQVQDFYPTPGTVSTCIFHTGLDPFTLKPVYVPQDPEEKAMQRALLQYTQPKNRGLVKKALEKAGRTDAFPLLLGIPAPGAPNRGPAGGLAGAGGKTAGTRRGRGRPQSGTGGPQRAAGAGKKAGENRQGRQARPAGGHPGAPPKRPARGRKAGR